MCAMLVYIGQRIGCLSHENSKPLLHKVFPHLLVSHSLHELPNILERFAAVHTQAYLYNLAIGAPLFERLEQTHAMASHARLGHHVVVHDTGGELVAEDVLLQYADERAH